MKSITLPHLPADPMRCRVAKALRDAIVDGRLLPGDRLVEAEMSERLQVSRGPIREALRQLEQEGLVVSHPYRGAEVLGLSQQELEEVLVPIRLTLERFAFRHALPILTDEDVDALVALTDLMKEAVHRGDLDGVTEADVRFHRLVVAKSGQVHCEQIWQTIEPRVRVHFRRDAPAHLSLQNLVELHVALIAAVRTRDPARVLPMLEAHIRAYLVFGDSQQGSGSRRGVPG